MMPPKKSKAARGHQNEEVPDTAAAVSVTTPPKKKRQIAVDEADIVEGKRKRTVPAQDQKLHDWISEHIEEREETRISSGDVYNQYLECCVAEGVMALEQHVFIRTLKSKFDKGYGVKPDSPYHAIIKEKKVRKKVVKVQAESLQLKMKDLIEAAIREHGNPKKGVRFPALKKSIAAKYPALRIDLRPTVLKNAIARGVRYGHIIAVRGIGAAGCYRVPLAEGEEEEEEDDKKKKKAKKETKENEEKKEGQEEDGGEKKDDGEVKENGDASSGEKEEEATETPADTKRKTRGAGKKADKGKDKKGKKGGKKAPPKKVYRSYIVHSDPQRIEDVFPMALTFMSEPKVASLGKIKKYFADYYPDVNFERVKKTLADGEEKGFWTHVSGTGATGSYQLELDDLDPSTDDNMNSKIANSIIGSNEPKQASALLIKRYIVEYHQDFKVADRPNLYKKALERAANKNQIRQITGIGATGTFQLTKPFIPTPTQLQGEDDEDYYEQSSDEDDDDDESEDEEYIEKMLDDYRDAYVPRPSKRRGHGRASAAGISPFTKSLAPVSGSRRRRR